MLRGLYKWRAVGTGAPEQSTVLHAILFPDRSTGLRCGYRVYRPETNDNAPYQQKNIQDLSKLEEAHFQCGAHHHEACGVYVTGGHTI
jgi:hypothetical protein